jgi:tetratricopeptide (TPR) repeat protein
VREKELCDIAVDCFRSPPQISPAVRFCLRIFLPLLPAVWLCAQEPLNAPAPLVTLPGATVPSDGGQLMAQTAARRAQELGFPSVAAALYREMLEQPGANRAEFTLALVTALMDAGRVEEAAQTLQGFVGLRDAAWRLRAGLIAAQQKRFDDARAAIAGITAEELVAGDRGWLYFLQGVLADAAGDLNRARGFHEQAETVAVSEMARVRFILAREQARLRMAPADANLLEEARKNMERLQGRKAGYGFARTYAVMLDSMGRKGDAIAELQRQLLMLPPEERTEADDFRLLLGLIAGADSGAGRNALQNLLAYGHDRSKQRMALQALARVSDREPARAQFQRELELLLGPAEPHPVREDLLLVRAQSALASKNYQLAEDDARKLLAEYPGSQLKGHALGVLTTSAWEQRRYRNAADQAAKAAAELPAGQVRAELGLLVAEAWFRARDYRSAADAYEQVLREMPAGVVPGRVMFQRVQAEIQAGQLDAAQGQLDALGGESAFDPLNRWQAEWNLARALQAGGQTEAAYARVNRLLATGRAETLPPDLRARMAWLQARLSFEAGQPEQTLRLTEALAVGLADVPAELRNEIASSGALLKAEASFALGRTEAALTLLKNLREAHPRADATAFSYIVEADHYAGRDQTVDAQRLLTKLVDDFPGNTYAPFALYQSALLAERRGQDANLEEANKLIEELVTKYPQSDYVFYARLKQGDLLRKLNQFPQAQQVYEALVNNFGRHQDLVLAQLALAECHNAQSLRDVSHAERAISLFEQLRDRVDAPVDVRVEAGFNLGHLLARRGQPARAEAVWWRDVVSEFLLETGRADQLGAKGRYWMARTLLELGGLYEQQAKLEQAQQAWRLILKTGLPGENLVRQRLARFNPNESKP